MLYLPPVILFDLDDTLISFDGVTAPALEISLNSFFNKYSPGFTKDELTNARKKAARLFWSDPVRNKAGRENMRQARRDVFKLTFEELGISDERLSNELADSYTEQHNELICLFPNTIPVLTELKSRGVRMGLITNGASDGQRDKLKRFDLERYFEAILIDQEVGYSKPDKRIFRHALEILGVSSADAWMVGDSFAWDVAGAQSAGIFAIWHDYEKSGLPADADVIPDRIINDLSELLKPV